MTRAQPAGARVEIISGVDVEWKAKASSFASVANHISR
jgi:hypothetical protein